MYTWNDGTYLMHHGIKGQKWGIRRFQNDDGSLTDAGRRRYYRLAGYKDGVSLLEKKSLFGKSTDIYEIHSNGKKVGDAIVDDDGDTLHLDWIGIKNSERRKGYGQKALNLVIQDAMTRGKRYVTLDAAGLDPAAVHIYEKQGFKAVKQIDDEIWNGLIVMRKDLKG